MLDACRYFQRAAFFAGRYGVFDRIFDQRLQDQARHERSFCLRLDRLFDDQAIAETHFFYFEVQVEGGEFRHVGKLGAGLSVEDGQAAARLCGINIIAQLKKALDGDLDRITRVVKLGGFVNSTPDFTQQPQVVNGVSDLMVEVFGDKGRHARAAVSAGSLPAGVSVEVDAVVEFA